jgi:hypothetical protein
MYSLRCQQQFIYLLIVNQNKLTSLQAPRCIHLETREKWTSLNKFIKRIVNKMR